MSEFMKTLTLKPAKMDIKSSGRTISTVARITIACIFAASIALSDTFNSSTQYSSELEEETDDRSPIKRRHFGDRESVQN